MACGGGVLKARRVANKVCFLLRFALESVQHGLVPSLVQPLRPTPDSLDESSRGDVGNHLLALRR